MRRLVSAGLVALLMSIALPALAAQPTPQPSQTSASAPPLPPPTGLRTGNFSASAGTDQLNGAVDYQVNGSGASGSGGSSSSHRSKATCVWESPQKAGLVMGPMLAPMVPAYNGSLLPSNGQGPSVTDTQDVQAYFADLYVVVCNGAPVSYGFRQQPAARSARTPTQIQTIAESAAGQIPMPGVSIEANPPVGGGTVHVDTWFYATRYSGAPIRVTPPTPGVSLTIVATPTSYVWDFGDGAAPITTMSLGVPWQAAYTPATAHADCTFDGTPTHIDVAVPGAVTHCWTQPSTGVSVSLTFDFAVTYSVNGGPAIALPPIQRTATLSYPVQSIDSVITARG